MAQPNLLQTKSENTRAKLIEAGIQLFSQNGYEATSTRQVQTEAAVQRNLITYHFGSKEDFWKTCMASLFDRVAEVMGPAINQSKDIAPDERIRFLIRRYIRVSAEHPELTRIMFDEGRCNEWRLDWIVDHYTRGFYETIANLFDQIEPSSGIPGMSVIQFYYVVVSGAAIFAMAPECQRLSGKNPFDEDMINTQANVIAALLTQSHTASGTR